MSQTPETEAPRRRTFAIISHPDAGKTTLTEHLLLAGGSIRAAGQVRARGENRRTRSDWMKIERERGISVSSSVMTFEHDDKMFNLLDTPGHEDFSEDTYRTLTAADAAIMVLDAAKGIEPQTLKLFEVCRLRDIPIITFINKMDREAEDPLALLDEVAAKLLGELLESRLALRAGRVLVRFGNRRADGEVVADEQRQRFDGDVLIALHALGLARQPIQSLGDGCLALVGRVRRQPGRQGGGDDAGFGHAFLGGQFIEPLGVFGLDKEVQAVLAHSSIPSLGFSDASRAVRCMAGSSWRGRGSGRSSSSSSSARSAAGAASSGA